MEERRVCSVCGGLLNDDNEMSFDGEIMCEGCYEVNTVVCDNCGRRIWRDNAEGDDRLTLCQHCYDECYTNCEDCGRLINLDREAIYDDENDYPYCRECYEKLTNQAIKSYNYKPEPIFYGDSKFYFGVELEVDKGGEDSENAREILDIGNREEEHIYCKHDGSLYEGFEIVSHPLTLGYHRNNMPWREIFDKAVELEYRSHNTDSCGLHFHVGRAAFGEDEVARDAAIGRVVYFVEKHWSELVKFSRRKEANLNRWAARYATISNTSKETYAKAKGKCMGRYVAVNLTNYETIEFRMFRGTLRYKTFIATLELVAHICKLAALMFDEDFEKMSWSDFVLTIDENEMPELIEYLKSKRLYVNEITENNEEE
jgi:hypothetical protein